MVYCSLQSLLEDLGPFTGGMRRTALHWACLNNHLDVIEVLVDAGADPRASL